MARSRPRSSSRAQGWRIPKKPIGSYLFSGPTGVGKTEVTRQLASVLGLELIRFDMSEYMERHTVSRLIGAPPGYVGFDQGGLLTEAITKHPHAVLLFDEIEKAHQDVFNLLLQVMDHGTLTDNNGRKADFRNVIIVMTTNAGAQQMARTSMGFTQQDHAGDDVQEIKKLFSPEFRNRLDAIIPFKPLDDQTILHVVSKFIIELESQLEDKHVTLEVDEAARHWLAKHGHDPAMGARPMARLHPGPHQETAGGRTAVRQARGRRPREGDRHGRRPEVRNYRGGTRRRAGRTGGRVSAEPKHGTKKPRETGAFLFRGSDSAGAEGNPALGEIVGNELYRYAAYLRSTSGRRAAILSSTRAAPEGCLRPCSHS